MVLLIVFLVLGDILLRTLNLLFMNFNSKNPKDLFED